MDTILFLFFCGILLTIYFIPTIIAIARDHSDKVAIVILNVFTGWTFFGWVGALVWASTNFKPHNRNS